MTSEKTMLRINPCSEHLPQDDGKELWRVRALDKTDNSFETHIFFDEDEMQDWIEATTGPTKFVTQTDHYELSSSEGRAFGD